MQVDRNAGLLLFAPAQFGRWVGWRGKDRYNSVVRSVVEKCRIVCMRK